MLSDGKGGNRLDPLSFSFRLLFWFTESREKREAKRREEKSAACSDMFSIQFFFYGLCLGQVKGFREVLLRFAWGVFAQELEFLKPASVVKPTLEVLLSVFRLCSRCCSILTATLLSRRPKHTEKNLLSFFFLCLFTSVYKGTKSEKDVLGFRKTRGAFKTVFCCILALLPVERFSLPSFSFVFFPAQIIFFACVYVAIVGGLILTPKLHLCCSFFSRAR